MNENVAIIGCGAICQCHGNPIVQWKDTNLVAVCDIKEERARRMAKILKCPNYYTDYKKMIDMENIDAIHLCVPHYLHPVIAQYVCNHGIHCITEKPMAISYEDARKMLECAKKNKVKLEVVFQNRFNAGSQLVKNTLLSGELGKILSVKANLLWKRDASYYKNSDWKGTLDKEGGGVIIDQAIHTLDLVRWLVDSPIEYVESTMQNRLHNYIAVEDVAEGIIKFKNNIYASFYANNYYGYDSSTEIELFCENGIAKIINSQGIITFNNQKQYIANPDQREADEYGYKECWGISHIKQIKSFYSYIRGESEQYVRVEDALETQKMICAIYESAKTKEKVYLDKM